MNVQCSWKVSDGRPISDAVFYNRDASDVDLEDEINVENCVFLKAPDKCEGLYPTVPACQLLISCEPPNQIVSISAICEAKVIEIYGHHGEYVKTVFNSPLEETDNLSVYRGDVILEKPLTVCSVKFVNLESHNEMWLFGVKIHTERISYSPQNQGISIPFAAMQQNFQGLGDLAGDKETLKKLADNFLKMGHLSNLQQQFKQALLQSACENLPNSMLNLGLDVQNSNDVHDTYSTNLNIENEKLNEEALNESEKSTVKNQLDTTIEQKISVSTSPVMFLCQSTSTQTEEDYTSIEENIKVYVNEQMKEINQKFLGLEAKIMCKLEEIESYVKPHGVP